MRDNPEGVFEDYNELVRTVVEDEDKLVPGGFYRDNKVTVPEAAKLDGLAEMQVRLWQESEQLTEAK